MKNSKRNLIILAVVFVIGTAGWLVVPQLQKAAATKSAALFETTAVKRMDLSDKIDVTGDVVTENNAAIYPPYSATVKQILIKAGVSVHKGDVLLKLQLKDTDLINYTSSWKSSLQQAEANLIMAQKALEREQVLFKAQATTIDDVETQQTKVRQYQAEVAEYRQKLSSLTKNGIDNNNDVLITAPFDAEVSWINVKLEEAVTTATELLTLGGNSAIRVEASVDQGDIDQIKVGLNATIKANDQNRTVIPGVVTSFGSTGVTSSNIVTFPVVIKPSGGQNASSEQTGANSIRLLKSGMTVDVSILADSHANVLAVPLTAVTDQNGQSTVQVLENGKLVSKEIQLGYKNTLYAEVLSGLAEGNLVAIPQTDPGALSKSAGSGTKKQTGGGMMGGPMGGPM